MSHSSDLNASTRLYQEFLLKFYAFSPTYFPEDEQVALKKKLKETLEGDVVYLWTKSGNDKNHTEKMETADPDKVKLSINTEKHTVLRALLQNS